MAVTLSDFRTQFPEFPQATSPDENVNRVLAEAREIHCVSDLATLFCAAHLLALDEGPKGIGAGSGEATMKQAGPLRVRYLTQAKTGRQVFFSSSTYGRRFLTLELRSNGPPGLASAR